MATPTICGKDLSGGALATNVSMTGADAGELYYDTSIGQLHVCVGSGTFPANFIPLGSAGNVAAGAAGCVRAVVKLATAQTDATFSTFANLTVPNQITGAGLLITAMGVLGDGDSCQMAQFLAAVSRVAGAATGITFGSAFGTATNNGVSGNSAVSIQNDSITGAVTATQTVPIQLRVTRSAGSAANHVLVVTFELYNGFGSGVTIAAA